MPELLASQAECKDDDKSVIEMQNAEVEAKCKVTGDGDPPNALIECTDRKNRLDNQKLGSVIEEVGAMNTVYPIQDEGVEMGECVRQGSTSFFSKIPRLGQIRSSISRSSFALSRSDSPKKSLETRSESLGPALFNCLHIQIQTGNQLLSRKIVFDNCEDREVCQHLLDNEKSLSNCTITPTNACKDLRIIRLAMHDAYSTKNEIEQLNSSPDIKWLNSLMSRIKAPDQIDTLFAFEYHTSRCWEEKVGTKGRNEDGWSIYLPVAEYQRLRFLDRIPTTDSKSDLSKKTIISQTGWRLVRNANFRLSPTYPQLLVVPSELSEEELIQSAKFRSRARLPVVIWKHPSHNCVLVRSSQPNYGMVGNRSEADRKLLKFCRDSANATISGASPPLNIIDARKPIATKGNRLRGKGSLYTRCCHLKLKFKVFCKCALGVENPHHYDNARIEYLGIVNIHRMRESLDALKCESIVV
ncbi:hypothetical protein ABG067_001442 [Albugo candida]